MIITKETLQKFIDLTQEAADLLYGVGAYAECSEIESKLHGLLKELENEKEI